MKVVSPRTLTDEEVAQKKNRLSHLEAEMTQKKVEIASKREKYQIKAKEIEDLNRFVKIESDNLIVINKDRADNLSWRDRINARLFPNRCDRSAFEKDKYKIIGRVEVLKVEQSFLNDQIYTVHHTMAECIKKLNGLNVQLSAELETQFIIWKDILILEEESEHLEAEKQEIEHFLDFI